jgi:methanogenic corrinoid protein MtbC1
MAPETPALSIDDRAGRLAAGYMLALLEGERRRAIALVTDAVRQGEVDVAGALLDVCLPAQRELGRMWHMNEITIAEEHFVTSTTMMLRGQLLALAPEPESCGRTVVTAALEDDAHDLGVSVVGDLFELDGWRVVSLGALVPVDDLVWSAETFTADLVVLAATLAAHRRAVTRAVETLRREHPVPVLVGGRAFHEDPSLWKRTGADGHAATAREAVPLGRRLAGLPAR